MNKEKISKVFYDLLEAWEDSESMVINDRGSIDDFSELRNIRNDYIERFKEAIKSEEV